MHHPIPFFGAIAALVIIPTVLFWDKVLFGGTLVQAIQDDHDARVRKQFGWDK